MSLVFVNGMDDNMHSGNVQGSATVGMFSFNTTPVGGRTGTTSLRALMGTIGTVPTSCLRLDLAGGGDATVTVGYALYFDTTNGSNGAVMLAAFLSDAGVTPHVTVIFTPVGGTLTAYRGTNAGAVLGTTTLSGGAIATNTWGYWEIRVVLSDTVGEVHVRYNGTEVLTVTGADTKNAGVKTVIDSIAYPAGFFTSGGTTYGACSDDMYVVTGTGTPNSFLGDSKVLTIYPNGNGDFSQLLGSDSNSVDNYALVNEAGAPVTTSYVESDTAGQRDFYTMADISILPSTVILGVQVTGWVNNPDAGSGRSAKLGVRQGSSEALSANQALTAATFLAVRGMFTTDPATGAAWTMAGVNSAQAGIEVG